MHDGYKDNSGISNGFKDEKAIKKERNFSPNFVVVWRKLVEELLHAVLLPHRVHVRHLVVREGGEEEVHLGWWSVFRLFRSRHWIFLMDWVTCVSTAVSDRESAD